MNWRLAGRGVITYEVAGGDLTLVSVRQCPDKSGRYLRANSDLFCSVASSDRGDQGVGVKDQRLGGGSGLPGVGVEFLGCLVHPSGVVLGERVAPRIPQGQ